MPLSFDQLNRQDGRADFFGELQYTVKSPFFEYQRMLNTTVSTDAQVGSTLAPSGSRIVQMSSLAKLHD